MRTSSCKAKGRRACSEVKDLILKYIPVLSPDDIVITSSGDTGEDLKFSPKARNLLPFTIECKNQEKINIWKSIKQSQSHGQKLGHFPLLAFKKNNHELMACLTFELFLQILTLEPAPYEQSIPPLTN